MPCHAGCKHHDEAVAPSACGRCRPGAKDAATSTLAIRPTVSCGAAGVAVLQSAEDLAWCVAQACSKLQLHDISDAADAAQPPSITTSA